MPALEVDHVDPAGGTLFSKAGIKARAFSRADWVFSTFSVADVLVLCLLVVKIYVAGGWLGSAYIEMFIQTGNTSESLVVLFICFSVDLYLAICIIENLRSGADMGVINDLAQWNSITNTVTLLVWFIVKICNPSTSSGLFVIVLVIRVVKLIPMVKFSRGTSRLVRGSNWDHLDEFGRNTVALSPYAIPEEQGLGSEEDEYTSNARLSRIFASFAVGVLIFGIISCVMGPPTQQLGNGLTTHLPQLANAVTPMPQLANLSTQRRLSEDCDDKGGEVGALGAAMTGLMVGVIEGLIVGAIFMNFVPDKSGHSAQEMASFLVGTCIGGALAYGWTAHCQTDCTSRAIEGGVAGIGLILAIVALIP